MLSKHPGTRRWVGDRLTNCLRATFFKDQADLRNFDTDVGKISSKSYILFITIVRHHTLFFFLTPLRFRDTEDKKMVALTLFFQNLVAIAVDGSNYVFLMLLIQYETFAFLSILHVFMQCVEIYLTPMVMITGVI